MNLDPGGIVGLVLCLGLVILIAFVTRRKGGRRPAGAPIHRRTPSYRRHLRREADDSDWGSSGDSGGSSCGSSCGGGGGGGD